MQTEPSNAASEVFAANRAVGVVKFDVALVDGVTRRRHLHESGSLRVRFPSPETQGLSAVFVNTAGGIAGGDRFDIDIATGEGARLTVTTAAAEKIYRAQGPAAQADLHPGDLIVSVDGATVDGIDALHRHLSRVAPGAALQLQVVRRTQLREITLTAREPP